MKNDERVAVEEALAAVHAHDRATGHGTTFFCSNECVEFICPRCGEILKDGPAYDDPAPGCELLLAPRRYKHRRIPDAKAFEKRLQTAPRSNWTIAVIQHIQLHSLVIPLR